MDVILCRLRLQGYCSWVNRGGGEVPCIPDHPVHVGSTPSNPSIHIYPRITIKTRQSEMADHRPRAIQVGWDIPLVVGDVCIDSLRCTEWSERMRQDQMIRTCRDFLSEYITIYGDFMLVTTYMYHPHVGLRGGLGIKLNTMWKIQTPLIQTNQQNKKLKRGNCDVDSSDTEEEISVPIILNNWPRFMLFQSLDPERPISKLSPFTIHQGIKGLAGVIGSDVPWLECPACNALTWVITVTE